MLKTHAYTRTTAARSVGVGCIRPIKKRGKRRHRRVSKSIEKKGVPLVTYAIASAGRFEPIPELDIDEVQVIKLTCGFLEKASK